MKGGKAEDDDDDGETPYSPTHLDGWTAIRLSGSRELSVAHAATPSPLSLFILPFADWRVIFITCDFVRLSPLIREKSAFSMIQIGKDADMLPSLVTRLGNGDLLRPCRFCETEAGRKSRKHVYLGILRLHCAMDTRTPSIPNTRL